MNAAEEVLDAKEDMKEMFSFNTQLIVSEP